MSRKEVPRAGLLKAARAGKITNAQGALAMQLSVRQFQRVKVRFAAAGAPACAIACGAVRPPAVCPPMSARGRPRCSSRRTPD